MANVKSHILTEHEVSLCESLDESFSNRDFTGEIDEGDVKISTHKAKKIVTESYGLERESWHWKAEFSGKCF